MRLHILGWAVAMTMIGCGRRAGRPGSGEEAARAFIARHLERVRPLEKAANLAWWQANISGKP